MVRRGRQEAGPCFIHKNRTCLTLPVSWLGFQPPAPPSCPVALAGLQGVVQGLGAGFKFMHLPGWCSSLSSLLAHPPGGWDKGRSLGLAVGGLVLP